MEFRTRFGERQIRKIEFFSNSLFENCKYKIDQCSKIIFFLFQLIIHILIYCSIRLKYFQLIYSHFRIHSQRKIYFLFRRKILSLSVNQIFRRGLQTENEISHILNDETFSAQCIEYFSELAGNFLVKIIRNVVIAIRMTTTKQTNLTPKKLNKRKQWCILAKILEKRKFLMCRVINLELTLSSFSQRNFVKYFIIIKIRSFAPAIFILVIKK